MSTIADKMGRGSQLTNAEQNLVMVNSAQIYSGMFGPMPADMHLTPMQLPENVKGILASFSL
jgi:hypothetical protein